MVFERKDVEESKAKQSKTMSHLSSKIKKNPVWVKVEEDSRGPAHWKLTAKATKEVTIVFVSVLLINLCPLVDL